MTVRINLGCARQVRTHDYPADLHLHTVGIRHRVLHDVGPAVANFMHRSVILAGEWQFLLTHNSLVLHLLQQQIRKMMKVVVPKQPVVTSSQ